VIKSELALAVARRGNILDGRIARQAVDAVFEELSIQLCRGEEIIIPHFGKFWVSGNGRKLRVRFTPAQELTLKVRRFGSAEDSRQHA